MDVEIRIAVEFLLSFVVKKFQNIETKDFVDVLIKLLRERFQGHWYPQKPNKGSAYRCITLNEQLDNVLVNAAAQSGFDTQLLKACLPLKLDLWIDPKEISYRIGEHGSVTQIYREDEDELNSKSEYAMAILKSLPSKTRMANNLTPTVVSRQQQQQHIQHRRSPMKETNRLSPTAKSFVSRRSPPLPIQVPPTQTMATVPMFAPKPVSNWGEHVGARKAYWQPAPVYDHLQVHNYILAHEIARFEAHMQAQRIALQTHYYKSPLHHVRRPVVAQNIPLSMPSNPESTNGHHLRVQVVA
eukprot:gene9118-10091_t